MGFFLFTSDVDATKNLCCVSPSPQNVAITLMSRSGRESAMLHRHTPTGRVIDHERRVKTYSLAHMFEFKKTKSCSNTAQG